MACPLCLSVCLFASIVAVRSQMSQPIACPPNERYDSCVSAVCHKTCHDFRYPPAMCNVRTPSCQDPGCVCQVGLLRNSQGVCVNIGDCDPFVDPNNDPDEIPCPNPNEKYNRCIKNVCHKYCRDISSPPVCDLIELGCFQPACVCDVGYLRNDAGLCVPLHECPLL